MLAAFVPAVVVVLPSVFIDENVMLWHERALRAGERSRENCASESGE